MALISLAGLPGVGKTTLARQLAQDLGAVHLRIDTLETAMRQALALDADMRDSGYRVAYALAADFLGAGHRVVADCVNDCTITRDAWRRVASRDDVPCIEIEIVCSDRVEHRRRAEARTADIDGAKLPSWREIERRRWEPFTRDRIVVDTAGEDEAESAERLARLVRRRLT